MLFLSLIADSKPQIHAAAFQSRKESENIMGEVKGKYKWS